MTREIVAKTRDLVNHHQRDILLAISLVLITWSSYNLGKMRVVDHTPITVTRGAQMQGVGTTGDHATNGAGERPPAALDPRVVVSRKSSSKKYHYSWCSGAKTINPENQVWFDTATVAETAGYVLAGNCQ